MRTEDKWKYCGSKQQPFTCQKIIIIIIYIYIYFYFYHRYARYLQLYTWNKPYSYGIQCCSCSVLFTICATCNVISPVKHVPYFYITSTSRSMCAVPKMAVVCVSLISCFPVLLLRYCLGDFEMFPLAPIFTGIIFLSHSTCAEFLLFFLNIFLYFKIYSSSFLITFLPPGIATSINMHVSCLLSRIVMPGLLLKMVLSVRYYYYYYYYYIRRPVSWSSGQSLWLLIMRSRVRFPVLPWEFSLKGRIPAVTMVWVV